MVVADRVLDNCGELEQYAAQHCEFHSVASDSYPGVKASAPEELSQTLLDTVMPELRSAYQIPDYLHPHCIEQSFSLVATPPEELHTLQRLPHFDSNQPRFFALLLYMSKRVFGGTGFFRHRPTGFERITSARLPTYIRSAQSFMREHGPPESRYVDGSDEHFEMIESVDHKRNRLLVYPGNLLHSGLIDPERDLDDSPETGRLTANVFVEFV